MRHLMCGPDVRLGLFEIMGVYMRLGLILFRVYQSSDLKCCLFQNY